MLKFYLLVILNVLVCWCNAQNTNDVDAPLCELNISKTNSAVKIDGLLNEVCWQNAIAIDTLWMKFPTNEKASDAKVQIKLSYDNKNLYIGAEIYDAAPRIGQSLKRDSRLRENDGLGVVLDPFNKKINGYYFSVTAFNVQADDVLSANNAGELSFSWDNKWYSQTKQYTDHYTIEMALPFNMLRYDASSKTWGINFIHSERKKNEFHTWTKIPLNFPGVDLGFLGKLQWDAPPPPAGKNIAIIPFTSGGINQDKEANTGYKGVVTAGADAKIALSSSLNLDVTLNPDFSQIEVDRQVTNLSRFNIFLPERRTFFLENNDLFSEYGNPSIRPFYSRTIGLSEDGSTLPIIGGLRLSGNVASRTRVGVLNMQTGKKGTTGAQNYTAINVQQQVFKRSSLKAYFLNHENFTDAKHPLKNELDKFGRNAGLDFAYTSNNGQIQGWTSFHNAIKPTITDKNKYINFGGGIFKQNIECFINYDAVGENYYTDMGYVQLVENRNDALDTTIRIGYRNWYNEVNYTFYKKKGKVIQYKIGLENSLQNFADGQFAERSNNIDFTILFKNTAALTFFNDNSTTKLRFPTAFTDGVPLPAGSYTYNQTGINVATDVRKNLAFTTRSLVGTYFGGKYFQSRIGVLLRKPPFFTLELNAEYNRLNFAAPYGSTELFLISPRVEINFTNALFWTTFLQYNTQSNNFNINSRLQWRYKPASDFFLVYTDNYFADPLFKNKNRALVFKLNYWLNL